MKCKNSIGSRIAAILSLFAVLVCGISGVFLSASNFPEKKEATLPADDAAVPAEIMPAEQKIRESEITVLQPQTEEETEAESIVSEEMKSSFKVDKNIGKVDVATGDSKKDEDGKGKPPVKDESLNESNDPGASIKPPEISKPKPTEPTTKPTTKPPTQPPTNPPSTESSTGSPSANPDEPDVIYPKEPMFSYADLSSLNGWQLVDDSVFYIENRSPAKGNKTIGGVKYYFNSYGAKASKVGIDISSHNGTIDWRKVKASGVDYVILRVGFRGYGEAGNLKVDANFEKNIKGASAAGLDVGIYFYSQAITVKEALEEASVTVKYIKDYKIKYPVYFDTEFSGGRADNLSKIKRTELAVAFCEAVKKEGYLPGVYASKTFFDDELVFSEIKDYEIWVAHYTAQTDCKHNYRMWQYTCKGTVSGISGDVDVNIAYYDYSVKSDMSKLGSNVVFVKNTSERDTYLKAEGKVYAYELYPDETHKQNALNSVNSLSDKRVRLALSEKIRKISEDNA